MRTKTTLSITSARKNIFNIAEEVQKGDTYYTLTERGCPKMVVLSAEKFETLLENKNKNKNFCLADSSEKKYASQVFAKTLIIRDESRVVYLSGDKQESKEQEEGLIKAQLYVELIEKYKYPLNLVELGRYVKVGPKEGKHYIEADVIVNSERGNVKMIFEVSNFSDFEEKTDKVVCDLFELANSLSWIKIANSLSWIKKPEYIVYFSRTCGKSENKEKIIAINYAKFNTFSAWKKAGRPAENKIPKFQS